MEGTNMAEENVEYSMVCKWHGAFWGKRITAILKEIY